MESEKPSYEEDLGNGLILRTVRDEPDVGQYSAFTTLFRNAREGATCSCLLRHHPEVRYEDFLLVEERRTGDIASTTCLIPWHCRYENVTLEMAMLEMVLTHPEYRRRGLIRTQIEHFHRMVNKRHFDVCIIQGIPYYYRQYGYTYATDAWGYDSLPVWRIPDLPVPSPYVLRQPTTTDVPALTQFFQDAMTGLQLYAARSSDYWRYLLQSAQFPVRIVEDQRDRCPVGYVCTMGDDRGLSVVESGITDYEVAMAVLCQLKTEASHEIRLGWPQTGALVQIGRSLGGAPLPAYQWLLRIVDIRRFLTRIGPALEHRLATSNRADLTVDLLINLFRQAFRLRFEAGKLSSVDAVGFVDASMGVDGGDLCIPPDAFVRLVFGYRTLDELRDAWPDIVVKPRSRHILGVLFPKIASYFCMSYHYCGPTPWPSPR